MHYCPCFVVTSGLTSDVAWPELMGVNLGVNTKAVSNNYICIF